MIPSVVASERGGWLNRAHVRPGRGCVCGVVGVSCPGLPAWRAVICVVVSGSGLGWPAVDGESPVRENCHARLAAFPE